MKKILLSPSCRWRNWDTQKLCTKFLQQSLYPLECFGVQIKRDSNSSNSQCILLSHSAVSNSLRPHELQPTSLLFAKDTFQARILEWVATQNKSRGGLQSQVCTSLAALLGIKQYCVISFFFLLKKNLFYVWQKPLQYCNYPPIKRKRKKYFLTSKAFCIGV